VDRGRTKKFVVLGLAAVLMLSSLGGVADAKKKKKKKPVKVERTAESTYDAPAIGHPDVIVGCSGSAGCATFAIGPDEAYIQLEIVDSTGLPVYGAVSQDVDGDGLGDEGFNICGSTSEPMPIQPGVEVNIFISAFPGTSPPCAGAATTGTVKAVISNLP
jgi:hypothetical protein